MSSSNTIRWGILASGNIANKFLTSARALPDTEVVAAASRTPDKAKAFCRKWDIPRHYTDYADLLADPEVDAVYVANTHNFHMETVILALEAGKPVLCEKPMAINAAQVVRMISLAREKNLFLMEALWTRFLPGMVRVREWLASGAIGEPRMIQASFGIPISDKERIHDPKLAGGALLDLGIYPLSLASMVAGGRRPVDLRSISSLLETGVDASSMVLVDYGEGLRANLHSDSTVRLENEMWIFGTSGKIHVPEPLIWAKEAHLLKGEEVVEVFRNSDPDEVTFKYEIAEVQRCLREGLQESPLMTLQETLVLAETMDALRKEWGVRYPGE